MGISCKTTEHQAPNPDILVFKREEVSILSTRIPHVLFVLSSPPPHKKSPIPANQKSVFHRCNCIIFKLILSFWKCYILGVRQYITFGDRRREILSSASTASLLCQTRFQGMDGQWNSLPTKEHLNHFWFQARRKTGMNIHVQVFVSLMSFHSSVSSARTATAGSYDSQCLDF